MANNDGFVAINEYNFQKVITLIQIIKNDIEHLPEGYSRNGAKERIKEIEETLMQGEYKANDFNSKIYQKAVNTFGEVPQLVMTMEETSELTQALSKYLRGKDNQDNIAEEIADVEIMLEQLKHIFNNSTMVNEYKTEKIQRLKRLLDRYGYTYTCYLRIKADALNRIPTEYSSCAIETSNIGEVRKWFLDIFGDIYTNPLFLSTSLDEFYKVVCHGEELMMEYLKSHQYFDADISLEQDGSILLCIEIKKDEESEE